jgi:hypothetical protein
MDDFKVYQWLYERSEWDSETGDIIRAIIRMLEKKSNPKKTKKIVDLKKS